MSTPSMHNPNYCQRCYIGTIGEMLIQNEITAIEHRLAMCEGWMSAVTRLCPDINPHRLRQLTLHMHSSKAHCVLALATAYETADPNRALAHTVSTFLFTSTL